MSIHCLSAKTWVGHYLERDIGLQTALNYTNRFKKNSELNLNTMLRSNYYYSKTTLGIVDVREEDQLGDTFRFEFARFDLGTVYSHRVNLNWKIGAGAMLRSNSNGMSLLRLIQQTTYARKLKSSALSFRLRVEQNLPATGEQGSFRLRLRAGYLLPLSGQSLDQKEFYLKINTEVVGTRWFVSSSPSYDKIEYRLIPLIGRNFKNTSRLELGLDCRYRFKGLYRDQGIWLNINWYLANK